jgi:hypothetical protein
VDEDEGAAFIFLGSTTGLVAQGTPANADTRIESNQIYSELGASVGGAGDVNGDGYDDIIVGASGVDPDPAYVFMGSAAGLPAIATLLDAAATFTGYHFGSVAGAGDVDGDGYDDIVIGDPFFVGGETQEGRLVIFKGSVAGLPVTGDPSTADYAFESDHHRAHLGWSVASAGDIDGDGYDEVIAGATLYHSGESEEGAALIYYLPEPGQTPALIVGLGLLAALRARARGRSCGRAK